MLWTDPPSLSRPGRRHGWRGPRALACAAAVLGCAACAPLAPVPPPPPPPPPPQPTIVYVPTLAPQDQAARQLLAYQAALMRMPPAEWPKEAARLGDGGGSAEDTVKLALVLGHTHAPGDLARALGLLDKVLNSNSVEASAWQGPARLLSGLYTEQRRVEDQVDRLGQQLRDGQRDNQRRLDQLNEKLEALKSIERSITNRAPASNLPFPLAPVAPPAPAPAPIKSTPRP